VRRLIAFFDYIIGVQTYDQHDPGMGNIAFIGALFFIVERNLNRSGRDVSQTYF